MTIEDLLKLQASEFADTETQKTREKGRSNAEQSALLATSRNEDVNSKIRAVMSGSSEDWRSKSSTTDSSEDNNYNDRGEPSEVKKRKIESAAATSRSEEIEKAVLASLSQSANDAISSRKRPLDVDAGTRITAAKISKLPKLEIVEEKNIESKEEFVLIAPISSESPKSVESPRVKIDSPKVKAPNLLELLKANPNNANAAAVSSSSTIAPIPTIPTISNVPLPSPNSVENIDNKDKDEELLNSSGNSQFILKYNPKSSGVSYSINCTGSTNDRLYISN